LRNGWRFPNPLSGVKRTWAGAVQMSAFDPKRTCRLSFALALSFWIVILIRRDLEFDDEAMFVSRFAPLQFMFLSVGKPLPCLGHLFQFLPVSARSRARHVSAFCGVMKVDFFHRSARPKKRQCHPVIGVSLPFRKSGCRSFEFLIIQLRLLTLSPLGSVLTCRVSPARALPTGVGG
jgi:hypothetical protein